MLTKEQQIVDDFQGLTMSIAVCPPHKLLTSWIAIVARTNRIRGVRSISPPMRPEHASPTSLDTSPTSEAGASVSLKISTTDVNFASDETPRLRNSQEAKEYSEMPNMLFA